MSKYRFFPGVANVPTTPQLFILNQKHGSMFPSILYRRSRSPVTRRARYFNTTATGGYYTNSVEVPREYNEMVDCVWEKLMRKRQRELS